MEKGAIKWGKWQKCGEAKNIENSFIYFTILPRAECCPQIKNNTQLVNQTYLHKTRQLGADKREMVAIMFKKTHIENLALHIMSINTFSKL